MVGGYKSFGSEGEMGQWDSRRKHAGMDITDKVVATHRALPCMYSYGIWIARNQMVF